jgi:hypothetical protein
MNDSSIHDATGCYHGDTRLAASTLTMRELVTVRPWPGQVQPLRAVDPEPMKRAVITDEACATAYMLLFLRMFAIRRDRRLGG